ncbi:MAG: MopE-related protein, partial [Pseudomonadota bacterium]
TVEADGPRMRVYHGPDLILQAEDASYLTGTVGFVADWDPYARWDDVRVTPLDSRGDACDPCPGTVDQGCVPACDDTDGDGYGTTAGSCGKQHADCASTDPSIYPGVAEVCDGLDNDCDGRVDENCTYVPTIYAYNAFNQIQRAVDPNGETTFEFDRNGNETMKVSPGGATEYVWDNDNRLKQLRLPSGVVHTMSYDPSGLRVRLQDDVGVRAVVLDGIEEIAEYDDAGFLHSRWSHSPVRVDEILGEVDDEGKSYFHTDALGSTAMLSGSTALVKRMARFDVFGQPLVGMGTTVWGFSSRRHDTDEPAFVYLRSRSYDSVIGAFISRDPISVPGNEDETLLKSAASWEYFPHSFWNEGLGESVYQYVKSNPVKYTDPLGLFLFSGATVPIFGTVHKFGELIEPAIWPAVTGIGDYLKGKAELATMGEPKIAICHGTLVALMRAWLAFKKDAISQYMCKMPYAFHPARTGVAFELLTLSSATMVDCSHTGIIAYAWYTWSLANLALWG